MPKKAESNLLICWALSFLLVSLAGCKREKADNSFNFPGISVAQLVNIYEGWAQEKVTPPERGWPNKTIQASTTEPVTAHEAMRLVEQALKEQAHVTIRRATNGSLFATVD